MRRACSGSAPSPASSSCTEQQHRTPRHHSSNNDVRSGSLFVYWMHIAIFAKGCSCSAHLGAPRAARLAVRLLRKWIPQRAVNLKVRVGHCRSAAVWRPPRRWAVQRYRLAVAAVMFRNLHVAVTVRNGVCIRGGLCS